MSDPYVNHQDTDLWINLKNSQTYSNMLNLKLKFLK